MARWTAKEMVLKINSTNEAILFLDAVQKQIKIVDIFADYYPGSVTIRFEGAKENLKNAIEIAKRIHQIVNGMLYPDRDDFYNYEIEFLSKVTGKTFPIKPLIQILEIKGYEPQREEGVFYSKIKYDSLLELIVLIDKVMSEIPYEVATSSLRDVILVMAITKNITIEQAIATAKKAKVVEEDELNRLKLIVEPAQALEKSLKITK
ncbi:MAG: DUF2067 family protein [Candidatus Heimdallarchaeota archaeon]|nr:DUF2067 family protein [Candidatus Heimdallarchaeota archaeon]MBY8995618.1 DUF2067 family protein [Candidatus Heimdallarchaeota archaeon]